MVASLAGVLAGQFTKAMTFLIDVVDQAAKPIESLVRVANPAIADAFGRAMQDAYGVIGRLLLPVMGAFIGVARKVGDLIAGMEPVFRPAMDAIANLVTVVGDELVKTVRENMPFFEMLAAAITHVAKAAATGARIIGEVLRFINRFASGRLARTLGFDGSSFDPGKSAVGAAARQARFVGPKDISDDAIKNALSLGVGQQFKKPEEYLNNIDQNIADFFDWAQRRFGQATGGAARIGHDIGKNIVKQEGGPQVAPGTGEHTGGGIAARSFRWGARQTR
jgi:hypothetical protein